MANKSVVVKPKKKKKNKCCGCLLTILITFVILIVGICAAGWFVGDYFTKQFIDMGIGDVLGVYMDIRTVNEKDVGLNTFSESDAEGFENALKDQLYIKSNTEIPYDEIFDAMLGGMLSDSGGGGGKESTSTELGVPELRNSFLMDVVLDHGVVSVEGETAAASNPIVDIIMPLLTRDNIDLDRLSEHTDQTVKQLTFTDKQLAGFLSKMVRLGMEKGIADQEISGINAADIMERVSIASVKISGSEAAPVLGITIRLQTAEIARTAAKQLLPSELSDFQWAVDMAVGVFLPKETFVAAELTLGDDPRLDLRLNGLSDEKMARMKKLVTNVGKVAGQNLDLDKMLGEVADEYITPYTAQLNNYLDYSGASGGALTTDLLGTALTLTGINADKEESDMVTSSDLYFTMKALLLSEPEVNPESTFRDQYVTLTGADAGEVIYNPADFSNVDKYQMVDYQEAFMEELRSKFLLSEDVEFSEIASLFGIGGSDGGSDSFIEKINFSGDEMLQLAKRPDASNKLILTDRMMGVLFDSFLDTIMGGQSMMESLNPAISHVTLKKLGETGAVHNWIEAAFTVDIGGAVDDPLMGTLMDALLPSSQVMLTVEIDITPDKVDEFYGEGRIRYNNLSDSDTMRLLDIIHKFAPGTDLSPATLLGQIEPEFRNVINEMFNLLPGIELGKSEQLDGSAFGGIEIGSVFEIAAKQLSDMAEEPTDPAQERESVTAEELRNVIVAMWDVEESTYTARPANENYDTFMAEIQDKYYLHDTYRDPDDAVEKPLESFDDLMKVVDPATFSDENFQILPDADSDKPSLAYDTRTLDELRAFLSDQDFGAIMKNELTKRESGGTGDLEGFTKIESIRMNPVFEWDEVAVVGASKTDDDTGLSPDGIMTMILSVDVSQFLSDGESMYLNLLPKALFFTLEFYVSPDRAVAVYADGADEMTASPAYHYYEYSMKLNEMEHAGDDYESLMKIIRLANGGNNPVEIDSVAREVGKALYEQLLDLREKLGESNLVFSAQYADPTDAEAGIDYGFSLGSIYDFLESSDDDGKLNAQELQGALQGMYAFDADNQNDNSYRLNGATSDEVIVFNAVDDEDKGYNIEFVNPPFDMSALITFTDKQFGYQLKTGGERVPLAQNPFLSGSGYELVQFDASATGGGETRLTITFEVQLNDFITDGDGARGAGYQKLAPEMMYFTFEILWNAIDGYLLVEDINGNAFTINQMTPAESEQLFLLIGYDTTGLNNQLADCIAALESMQGVTYGSNEVFLTISQWP